MKRKKCQSNQGLGGSFRAIIFLLFMSIYPQPSSSVPFEVMVPKSKVVVAVGTDLELTFYLSPKINAESMEIGVSKRQSSLYVHLYSNGMDVNEGQMAEYLGRTKLDKENIKTGKISLVIRSVVPSDEEDYLCYFQSPDFYNSAVLSVTVTAIGLDPLIQIKDYFDNSILVECESDGWYPEPEIVWRDSNGKNLPSIEQNMQKNENGLYRVQSSINVFSNSIVFCSIRNIILNEGWEPSIYLTDTLYKRVDRCGCSLYLIWIISFSICAIVPGFFITCIIIKIKQSKGIYQEFRAKKNQEHDTKFTECGHLEACLQAKKVSVSLDPETAHRNIVVSEDGKSVYRTNESQDLRDNSERFDKKFYVLGKESFKTGKVYWNLKADNVLCSVGIAKKSIPRKIEIDKTEGIFLTRLWESELFKTDMHNVEDLRLQMYLDCDKGQLIIIQEGQMVCDVRCFPHNEEVVLLLEVLRECRLQCL